MSAITMKPSSCVTCGKEIPVLKCESCWQIGYNSQSGVQYGETDKAQQQHALIQQVDDWECNAINRIRETAEEARRIIIKHTTDRISLIAGKLTKLTEQLQQCQRENNFHTKTVTQWQTELVQLSQQMVAPSSITVRKVALPLVTKIVVHIPALIGIPNITPNVRWTQNAVTVAGGNGQGKGLNQFNTPLGLCVDDDDQTIYVVDQANSRVVEWEIDATSGQVVAGGNGQGNQANQLDGPTAVIIDKETNSLIIYDFSNMRVVRWPRRNGTTGETLITDVASYGLTMDSDGYLYVSDYNRHEVKRWKIGETNGIVVAGGNGQGSRLSQLSNPMHIFVDQDRSVYVSDYSNHRVMKWIKGAREGVVVAGGQGRGSGLAQLCYPRRIVVDQLGTVYVTDCNNNRVMRWLKGATQGSVVVGGNGGGAQPNQFNSCGDLSFDRHGNLYIADTNNNRIQKFHIDPTSFQ